MSEKDLFKEAFKYYKKKIPSPNLDQVTDFDSNCETDTHISVKNLNLTSDELQCLACEKLGLRNHYTWNLHSLNNLDGFIHIRNPFKPSGQQIWIKKCLEQYPRKPAVTNLDIHHRNLDDIWSLKNSTDPEEKKYLSKLCWTTLGYHHNWDTKVYDSNFRSEFPHCLEELSKHIGQCLGLEFFKPEAAIVNYYNLKSSLSIHNDHSEEEMNAPIISFSFGQTGIFLIGTENKFEKPTAIFLRSGDVIIMSGACRLSYHAVPCIILENNVNDRYFDKENSDWIEFENYINNARINISVRQVYANKS